MNKYFKPIRQIVSQEILKIVPNIIDIWVFNYKFTNEDWKIDTLYKKEDIFDSAKKLEVACKAIFHDALKITNNSTRSWPSHRIGLVDLIPT